MKVVFQKIINYGKHFPKILWKTIFTVQEKTHPLRRTLLQTSPLLLCRSSVVALLLHVAPLLRLTLRRH